MTNSNDEAKRHAVLALLAEAYGAGLTKEQPRMGQWAAELDQIYAFHESRIPDPMGIAVPLSYRRAAQEHGRELPQFIDPRAVYARGDISKIQWWEVAALCEFAMRVLNEQASQTNPPESV